MIVFYEYMEQPRYWIAHDAEGYWLVPVRTHGWQDREPFVGRMPELRMVELPSQLDLGLPDSSIVES